MLPRSLVRTSVIAVVASLVLAAPLTFAQSATPLRVIDGGPEFLVREVRRIVPGPETPPCKVDRVGAGGDCCGQGFRRTGRSEQFRRCGPTGL